MFRNYLLVAWRAARRDWFYSLLNIVGLALGFAVAILIGLYVRDELSYDRFLPGYEDVYRVQLTLTNPGERPVTAGGTPKQLAAELKLDFPEIVATARWAFQQFRIRRGDFQSDERLTVVDPSFLSVIRIPMLRGDPATALADPNTIVLTRSTAEKYFGTLDCVGQILQIDDAPTRVTGIVDDAPSNISDRYLSLISGKTPGSRLALFDASPAVPGELAFTGKAWVQLPHGMNPEQLTARFPAFVETHFPNLQGGKPLVTLFLNPLSRVHLHPSDPDSSEIDTGVQTLFAVAATALLILLLAGINFVNLLTARAMRRATEIGVRKTHGAERHQIVLQFMSEALAYSLAGIVPGIALAQLLLPRLNAFFDRKITFEFWRHPELVAVPVAAAILFGVAAGFYPAVMVSRFPAAQVLKARSGGPIGSGRLRLGLVVFQFTVTIALLIATVVIYRQTGFATGQALGFDKNLKLYIRLLDSTPWVSMPNGLPHRDVGPVEALRARLSAVPGVEDIAGSYNLVFAQETFSLDFQRPGQVGGPPLELFMVPIDFGYFNVYDLPLLAGRNFSRDFADDPMTQDDKSRVAAAIINETAVHALGYANPADALGHEIDSSDPAFPEHRHRIVGVVPDFPLSSIRDAVPPSLFFVDPLLFNYLSLKLSGTNLVETLNGIDTAWHDAIPAHLIDRHFLDDRLNRMYVDEIREGRLMATLGGIAGLIGCLGLIGLSAYTAERRTKEMGIRKALGASTLDVGKLMIWEFAKPVLLANLLAWPIAWWFMRRWLDGFAYRIDLDAMPFLAIGVAAIAIAVATTAFFAIQLARSRPVTALRYE